MTIIHSDAVDFRFYSVVQLLKGELMIYVGIDIARMMMVSIYHVISEKKPFQPTDYEELMNPHNRNERIVLEIHFIFHSCSHFGYFLQFVHFFSPNASNTTNNSISRPINTK